jgi:L-iditol 2-dehydrogenase
MKAAMLYGFNDIRIEDVPVPRVKPGHALLRTRACGICSGDVMPWYIEKKAPLVIGHELSGEIVEVGRGVTAVARGDRVFVHHHAPCFSCRYCRRGDYVQCATWRNSRIMPGGVSEYVLIPPVNLKNDTLRLSEEMTFEDGALIEPAACVVKGLKRAAVRRGDTVLVLGLGVMGIMNVAMARQFGAGRIIGADRVKFRLEKALEAGADQVINVTDLGLAEALNEITKSEMAEIVIVGPNSAEAMSQGIRCVRPGGQVLFFTPAKPEEKLVVDPNHLYFNDVNIITSYSCGPTDTADAFELIKKGVIPAEMIVTHRFPIEKTEEAFRLTATAGDSLKCMIVFD